ncbi:MAG: tRNA (uridine(54)-C5)-methyltransferase TrmA [Campylobacterota bacterium]
MICEYFGKCASCFYYDRDYRSQLKIKVDAVREALTPFYSGEYSVFESPDAHFRARAEFRVFRNWGTLSYAMHDFDKRLLPIQKCPKVLHPIDKVAFELIKTIEDDEYLSHKLYAAEFLSGLSGELLVTLIYHKKLDEHWQGLARQLQEQYGVIIIGRSRKQKVVIEREYIIEKLHINSKLYRYRHYEGSFTQPNPYVNEKMIEWAISHASKEGDLLESYCGAGNFTIPLASYYDKVLATEISKKSIQAAKHNCQLNDTSNIEFVRLSSQELTQALNKEREFTRLRGIDLASYGFKTVLVDPPRAGLDDATAALISSIDQIIYISCNFETLARDLELLCKTHRVAAAAVFDQFAYSKHVESGVILEKKES